MSGTMDSTSRRLSRHCTEFKKSRTGWCPLNWLQSSTNTHWSPETDQCFSFFLYPLVTYLCRTEEKTMFNFTANGHWSLKTRCPTDSPTSRYSRSLPLIITANDTRLTDWLIDHQLSKQRIHSWLIDWVLLIVNAQSTVTVMFRQTQFITSKVLFTVRVKHYFTLEENWKNEVEWTGKSELEGQKEEE